MKGEKIIWLSKTIFTVKITRTNRVGTLASLPHSRSSPRMLAHYLSEREPVISFSERGFLIVMGIIFYLM